MNEREAETFLARLLTKRAHMSEIGRTTGKDITQVLNEVDKQIQQCVRSKGIVRGYGVEKSGEED